MLTTTISKVIWWFLLFQRKNKLKGESFMEEKIVVTISDCFEPEYFSNSNYLHLTISKTKLEDIIKICEDSKLCLTVTYDFTEKGEEDGRKENV